MRLFTVDINGTHETAVMIEDRMVPLYNLGIHVKDMNELIDRWDELEPQIRQKSADAGSAGAAEYRVLSPISVPKQDVVCLGVNYREHIEETSDVLDFSKKEATVYFSKRVNAFSAPDDIIPYYDFVDSLDYEVELGVVLKKDAFGVSPDEAADCILGYTIINDVSARNLQLKHSQWYLGKSLDGYTPMGPAIVTPDELENVHDLKIRLWVNDELRQDSSTKYMITSAEEAISEFSQGITLKAGTVIATGTPGGVGMGMKPPAFLQPGDVVKCEIEGIGILSNTVGEKTK